MDFMMYEAPESHAHSRLPPPPHEVKPPRCAVSCHRPCAGSRQGKVAEAIRRDRHKPGGKASLVWFLEPGWRHDNRVYAIVVRIGTNLEPERSGFRSREPKGDREASSGLRSRHTRWRADPVLYRIIASDRGCESGFKYSGRSACKNNVSSRVLSSSQRTAMLGAGRFIPNSPCRCMIAGPYVGGGGEVGGVTVSARRRATITIRYTDEGRRLLFPAAAGRKGKIRVWAQRDVETPNAMSTSSRRTAEFRHAADTNRRMIRQ